MLEAASSIPLLWPTTRAQRLRLSSQTSRRHYYRILRYLRGRGVRHYKPIGDILEGVMRYTVISQFNTFIHLLLLKLL